MTDRVIGLGLGGSSAKRTKNARGGKVLRNDRPILAGVRAVVLVATICSAAFAAEAPGGDSGEKKTAARKFIPGEEVKLVDSGSGELGYYLVYVPKGYVPTRSWPVIVCYHGLNGRPTTSPFKAALGGRHYIIIAMGYYKRTKAGYDYLQTRDVDILKRILRSLSNDLAIDRSSIYVGGFSKGAFYASGMINAKPRVLAGAIMLGGGKHDNTSDPRAFQGKPIFVGCGSEDIHLQYAKEARVYYSGMGAKVTFQVWKGVAHSMGNAETLFQWLLRHGPLKNAQAALAAAGKMEKVHKLGPAYAIYNRIAKVSDIAPTCVTARKAAARLSRKAAAQFAAAKELLAAKRYVQGAKALLRSQKLFQGSELAQKAADRLSEIRGDPRIRAIIRQADIDAKADILEARAQAAEKKLRYAQAIKLYEMYVRNFPQATGCKRASRRLAHLKTDGKIQDAIRNGLASRRCKPWLSMADNHIASGKYKLARSYLQKIIDNYGQTQWAQKARQRLAKIATKGRF